MCDNVSGRAVWNGGEGEGEGVNGWWLEGIGEGREDDWEEIYGLACQTGTFREKRRNGCQRR
jgi:hypothetical protein